MMKKIIPFILSVLVFFNLFSFISYGKPLSELPYTIHTEEELKTPIDLEGYSVFLDGEKSDKEVVIAEYVNSRGTFLSLREIVEALGGSIEWAPKEKYEGKYFLGRFSILGYDFEYYGSRDLHGESDIEDDYPVDFYMNYNGKCIGITMSTMINSIYGKFKDNRVYVQTDFLRAIMPRIGYISSIDKESKTISVEKYDFENEKKIMLEKFPEKFLKNKKSSFYFVEDKFNLVEGHSEFKRGSYSCYDKYYEQYHTSLYYGQCISNFIAEEFKYQYAINRDNTDFCENLIKVAYMDDFEGQDINIIYDEDLKAYIITNAKDFDSITYDENLKLIVVRAADAMLLFKYNVD